MDGIKEWTRAHERVIGLVEDLTAREAAEAVPACPDWSVRQLFSHMVGLGADVLAGDEPDDHNSDWTQRQVDDRARHDIPALVAEWRELADPLRAWMVDNGTRPLGDVIIHEQDLRGALNAPGGQDSEGMAAIRDMMLGLFTDSLDGHPPIALVGQVWRWCSHGDPGSAATVLSAPDFELARALMSRRSSAQLRAWTTRGDIELYLDAFATLGALPHRDLSE